MNGAEYIAEFLRQRGCRNIFVLTGGACAFIIDAIHRNKNLAYTCFQHEQGAAMAADSLWRIDKAMGVTVATSGPGATNLITGIACSYFDSIPAFHITGQVNQTESANYLGAKVRQAGFQETNIVDMVKPITKYAVQVKNGNQLKEELTKAWNIAITDRKGPVLVDVPINVQKEEVGDVVEYNPPEEEGISEATIIESAKKINEFFKGCERPLVLFGAGVGLSGGEKAVEQWLVHSAIPFVSSWNGITYFDHDDANYYGAIGVYGNRGANFLIQNCDRLLVLGSRLDNRQRSGNPRNFAISAKVLVIDVDEEELKKYRGDSYEVIHFNLKEFEHLSKLIDKPVSSSKWKEFASAMKNKYFGKDLSEFAKKNNSLSPYAVVQKINEMIDKDAIVIADTGANLCWVFQMFHRTRHTIFTAGGNSPMGYSLPAGIGAALHVPDKQIVAFTGDGSLQINIQELQTLKYHNLNVKVVLLNNAGYGIIKQFQDLNFSGQYAATGEGYSVPEFGGIVKAYGIKYFLVNRIEDLEASIFSQKGPCVIEVALNPNTLIEPKLELGKPIHNQYPYLSEKEFKEGSLFCKSSN